MATHAQHEDRRRTWAIETMLAAHPEMARATAEAICQRVAARLDIAPAMAVAAVSSGPRAISLRLKRDTGSRSVSLLQPRIALVMATLGIALAVGDVAWRLAGLR